MRLPTRVEEMPVSTNQPRLRVAVEADAEAVTAVLASAYPRLLAIDYDPAVLAVALPAMTVANPGLLASGTYYVQEVPGGRIVSCGGWTHGAPGSARVDNGIAHIRHFGTDVDWLRQGLGRGIFERCKQDGRAANVHAFRCFSSIGAEPFYTSLGFCVVERMTVPIGGEVSFPAVVMVWTDRPQAEGEIQTATVER